MRRRGNRHDRWSAVLLAVLLAAGAASAAGPQTPAQRACLNGLNRSLARALGAFGKAYDGCLRDAAGASLDACAAASATVTSTLARSDLDAARTCGAGTTPDFGARAASDVRDTALLYGPGFIRDMLGSHPDASVALTPAPAVTTCRRAVTHALRRCETTFVSEFNRCKRAGLRSTTAPITDAASLAACLGQDPRERIEKACDAVEGPIARRHLPRRCAGLDLRATFPGCDTGDPAAAARCFEAQARCRACVAVVQGDDLGAAADCDLLDDGLANTSCPGCGNGLREPGERCDDGNRAGGDGCSAQCTIDFVGSATCRLDESAFCDQGTRDGKPCTDFVTHGDCPGGLCLPNSHLAFHTRFASPLIVRPLSGKSVFQCGAVDPDTGVAACTCDQLATRVVELGDVLGYLCIKPAPGCSGGVIDCDGGAPLDVDFDATHLAGTCGLSDDPDEGPFAGNQECEALCADYCAALPGDYVRQASACEGYCTGGTRADQPCTIDLACPDGFCEGGNPVTHANKCHCQCRQVAGAPSRPGAVQCQFAVRITREGSPSCNGQNVLEVAGDRCIQITSEAFAVRLQNADLTGATIDVGPLQGNPPMCRPRDEARSGTAVTRGGSITFEAAGGDMAVPMTVTCVTACGDGVLDPGEDCDDGGLVSGDGCDDRCRIEPPGPRGSHTCTLDTAAQCQGGDRDGLPCIDTATHGDCPPGPSGGARCLAESRLELHSRTAQPLLTAPVRGSVRIDCDAFDPLTGTSPCACAIEQLDPVDLGPFLGIACFEPLAGCDEGTLDCDGGQPRDAETIAAHSIGSCGLADPVAGPAECRAACDAHCAALGDGFARIQSACEGSCRGGSRADQVCSFDFECPGGECPGGDPVAHANRCQCECERSGGRPASPGALTCPLGLRIRLETALPCDGEDVRAERRVCTRLTTEQASGEIRNADVFGVTVAADARGQAAGCATLSAGALGPTTLAGHLALFDSTHGDLVAPLRLACE